MKIILLDQKRKKLKELQFDNNDTDPSNIIIHEEKYFVKINKYYVETVPTNITEQN